MLKKIWKLLLLLGVIVCTGSACVTPTHASSALAPEGIILTHVYPATVDGSAHELIALYNNTGADVTVTGWCIANKAEKVVACFSDTTGSDYIIEARQHVVIASADYVATSPEGIDITFTPIHKTNGSLVGSSDVVILKDAAGAVVDRLEWSVPVLKGYGYSRDGFNDEARVYEGHFSLPTLFTPVTGGGMYTVEREVDVPVYPARLLLSELLPNPRGSDAGNEFIELYNDSSETILLDNYSIIVSSGTTRRVYSLPLGQSVPPGEYRAFTNADVAFSLNNTRATVELMYKTSGLIIDSVSYDTPPEGSVWTIDFESDTPWQYSTTVTPNRPNIISQFAQVPVVKVCKIGQYLNVETGRCRNIATASAVALCKEGQYRNEETGRCRKVVESKVVAACKSGQERNPETNRCRNIKAMTKAGNGIPAKVTTVAGGVAWYAWVAVAIIIAAVLLYAAWEWRYELHRLWQRYIKRSKTG